MHERLLLQLKAENKQQAKKMTPLLAPALVYIEDRKEEKKIVGSQLKVGVFEVEVNIRGILLGRLNNVDDTESLLSAICWAPLYWAV